MKKYLLLPLILCILICRSAAAAEKDRPVNPSFYNGDAIVNDVPSFWTEDLQTIEMYMEQYPDMLCTTYPDTGEDTSQIVCESVNNRNSQNMVINFWFWGDYDGRNGLQSVVFTLETPTSERVQDVMEWYHLNLSYPDHADTAEFYHPMISLYYRTDTTRIRYDLPQYAIDGLDYTIVDITRVENDISE